MSETPQQRVSRWLNDPLVDLADTEVREAIRAVLAENASVNRVAGHLSDLATWWVGKAGQLEAEVERLRAEGLAIADGQIADRERLERLLRRLVDGIDQWNATVTPIIGRPVDYWWPALEEARAAAPEVKPCLRCSIEDEIRGPEHRKHPSGDYCVWCRAQWPCEEAEVTP